MRCPWSWNTRLLNPNYFVNLAFLSKVRKFRSYKFLTTYEVKQLSVVNFYLNNILT